MLTYEAKHLNLKGQETDLPKWIEFDPVILKFKGTPPKLDSGIIVKVIVKDVCN